MDLAPSSSLNNENKRTRTQAVFNKTSHDQNGS
jgi:hypothetical protein